MLQQCTTGQTVQDFGQFALHARALAGSHDDHIDWWPAGLICATFGN
jgi:hypothetical protein